MAANLLNNAQSEEVNEGNKEKKTSAERLSAGRLAAASCKLWSSAAMPGALCTVPDLAQGWSLTPATLARVKVPKDEAAAMPHGFPARTADGQTDICRGRGAAGSHVAAPW